MEDQVRALMERQKNKCIRTLLGAKERQLDEHLPTDVQMSYRKIVLDSVNLFFEFCVDVLETNSSQPDVLMNDLYLEKLEEIQASLAEMAPI